MAAITSIGKFQVVGTLGQGAHSTILQVRRSADSKTYALKVVPIDGPEDMKFLEQAQHEYQVGQLLEHPNLIKIHCFEQVRDWLFRVKKAHLLIEYVNGKTLDTYPKFKIAKLVQIFEKIASGLVQMHRRGVFHADLKPNNIILSKTGQVKIIDYGLAWTKGESKNRVQGTPEYMAPEQARNKMVNERTDIYNLGATMYRLTTWRLPPSVLAAEGGMQADAKTWHNMLKPVKELNPECPPALAKIIEQCLQFNANKRPERVSEVQGALDHLVDELVRSPDDRLEAME